MGVCLFGTQQACSDGLSCTDDICNESTKSCENPPTNCQALMDPCASEQCIEPLGGCQFTCGATLDMWTGIHEGIYYADLSVTYDLTTLPNKSERLGISLESPTNRADYFVSRMKGWLVPPVSGEFVFWIAASDSGEFWLSSNDNPMYRVLRCHQTLPAEPRKWTTYPEQKSAPISLVADEAYYFEVRTSCFIWTCCSIFSVNSFSCLVSRSVSSLVTFCVLFNMHKKHHLLRFFLY